MKLIVKWMMYIGCFLLFGFAFASLNMYIGFDGWQKTEESWDRISLIVIIMKYTIAILLAMNWRAVCQWYGKKRGAEEFGDVLADNWRIFLIMFVVIEMVGFLS